MPRSSDDTKPDKESKPKGVVVTSAAMKAVDFGWRSSTLGTVSGTLSKKLSLGFDEIPTFETILDKLFSATDSLLQEAADDGLRMRNNGFSGFVVGSVKALWYSVLADIVPDDYGEFQDMVGVFVAKRLSKQIQLFLRLMPIRNKRNEYACLHTGNAINQY